VKHRATTPWTLPGGHVEKEETFQDAFIREAKEELNLVIRLITDEEPSKEKGVTLLPKPTRIQMIEYTNHRGPVKKYEEFFLAEVISGTLKKQDEEIFDYTWKTLEEIEKIPKGEIFEGIREIILGAFEDDSDED
jgi:8-oxo-dGTP pyrophosphatase MutT (NUDIX family)